MPISASKRWNNIPEANPEQVHALTQALFIAPEIAALLVQRGIDTPEAAAAFFHPDLRQLPNPLLMRDMDRAVTRLAHALQAGEKVMVLGDYDVDGITSVATVMSYLTPLFGAERLRDYIPDRYTEGYGISQKAIDFAADNGFQLIVALDCGIKAVEPVAYASSRGVDFIICDHHLPGDELPAAVAVLDPKRADCAYPYKELSGCGVGFKLMQALGQHLGLPDAPLFRLARFGHRQHCGRHCAHHRRKPDSGRPRPAPLQRGYCPAAPRPGRPARAGYAARRPAGYQ